MINKIDSIDVYALFDVQMDEIGYLFDKREFVAVSTEIDILIDMAHTRHRDHVVFHYDEKKPNYTPDVKDGEVNYHHYDINKIPLYRFKQKT